MALDTQGCEGAFVGTRLTLGIFNTGTGPEKTEGIVHIHGLNASGKGYESVSTDIEIRFESNRFLSSLAIFVHDFHMHNHVLEPPFSQYSVSYQCQDVQQFLCYLRSMDLITVFF